MEEVDVLIVGAGIVGLATARAVLRSRPRTRLLVVDKEDAVAHHQSGRNSGVIHAGVYYPPGSDKARWCVAGRSSMVAYCAERGIPHEVCGKVVVATDDDELGRLGELARRCEANGVRAERIDARRLREIEPHARGLAALHVHDTGVVDYAEVCRSLRDEIEAAGGAVRLGVEVRAGHESEHLVVETDAEPVAARRVVTCAGLHADRVATAISGPEGAGDLRIVAFRGEYHSLAHSRRDLVRGLIYPVPDPRFPFLGVHLTRGVDGDVHIGPNALLAFAREGYRWREVDLAHLRSTLASTAFRRFASENWRYGVAEMVRSASRRRLVGAARRLLPELEVADLRPAPSGVRAQAIAANGRLVDDFAIRTVGRAVHVLNAPSPAATASLEIGREIAARLDVD